MVVYTSTGTSAAESKEQQRAARPCSNSLPASRSAEARRRALHGRDTERGSGTGAGDLRGPLLAMSAATAVPGWPHLSGLAWRAFPLRPVKSAAEHGTAQARRRPTCDPKPVTFATTGRRHRLACDFLICLRIHLHTLEEIRGCGSTGIVPRFSLSTHGEPWRTARPSPEKYRERLNLAFPGFVVGCPKEANLQEVLIPRRPQDF